MGFVFDRCATDIDLITHVIRQEELVMVMPPDHPLASSAFIKVQELAKESLVLTEEGCTYRGMLMEALRESGFAKRVACQFSNPEAIKSCVRCGLGVALLPIMTVERERKEGSLAAVPFHSDKPPFYIQLVYHKKKWLSPSMEWLIQSITSQKRGEL